MSPRLMVTATFSPAASSHPVSMLSGMSTVPRMVFSSILFRVPPDDKPVTEVSRVYDLAASTNGIFTTIVSVPLS